MKRTIPFSAHRIFELAMAAWGACIILLQVLLLWLSLEETFLPGGMFLLLVSLAAGISLLLAPWLKRRSGYLVLVLAGLWWLGIVLFRHDDRASLMWGLMWGMAAYTLPGILLVLFSQTTRQPGLALTIGVLAFVLVMFVVVIGLGISRKNNMISSVEQGLQPLNWLSHLAQR